MNSKVVRLKGGPAAGPAAPAAVDESGVLAEEKRGYNRVPYSGNLDEVELNRPGGMLLAALISCANERRMQLNDMAAALNVTYGYINQLRNGIRRVDQVSDDFALACARFLGMPRLTVLMLAGRITPEDAFEYDQMAAAEIARAMSFICDDPVYGPMMTTELRSSSTESQYALVRMYEKATDKKLLASHIDLGTLAEEIKKLRSIQAERARAGEQASARKRSEG